MFIDEGLLKYDEKSVYKLRSLYKGFGYSQFKMNKFEEYDLYVKNKDFLISDGVITFTDTSGKLLALKPDVTLSIINNSKDVKGQVQKVYYNENVYRISGSSKSYKEIMQTGLECVGDLSFYDICEVLILALKSLSIIDPCYILQISHIGLLDEVMLSNSISGDKKKKIIDLISHKNNDGIKEFCESENLGDGIYEKLKVFTQNYSSKEDAIRNIGKVLVTPKEKECFDEFKNILEVLSREGYDGKYCVDFSVANDMVYYSGVVFKGYINSIPTGVCSGGQYDKLMKKMGRNSSAIGFAVYLDALERFKETEKEYDVDNLLITDEEVSNIFSAVKVFADKGESVRVVRKKDQNIRYKKAYKLIGKELVECGND